MADITNSNLNMNDFLEGVTSLVEIAKTQKNVLTKEEIKEYMGEDLSDDEVSKKAVYDYLSAKGVTITGYETDSETEAYINDIKREKDRQILEAENENLEDSNDKNDEDAKDKIESFFNELDDEDDENEEDSKVKYNEFVVKNFYKLDDEELNEKVNSVIDEFAKKADVDRLSLIYEKIFEGDKESVNNLIVEKMEAVEAIAKYYVDEKNPFGDLCAEGNLKLVETVNAFANQPKEYGSILFKDGKPKVIDIEKEVFYEVKSAVVGYISENKRMVFEENAIVSRLNLLQSAREFLKEELKREPSQKEVEEYTGMTTEEIQSLDRLKEV